jgi:three-Cys-motif partner protein
VVYQGIEGIRRQVRRDNTERSFFDRKRPWSKIKDAILAAYLPPYLKKTSTLGKPILILDCFAGPGTFASDQGTEAGSPLIICQAIAAYGKGNATAMFVNHRRHHHEQLSIVLQSYRGIGQAIHGNSQALLGEVTKKITDHTVLIYLDPFGLKGCSFDALRPLLARGKQYSTEILVNLSMPTYHRFASTPTQSSGVSHS